MLEMASQEDQEDDYELDSRVIESHHGEHDDGSENAPDDSAYISDEQDDHQKIVNESSLVMDDTGDYGDDQLMMTGRSESIIDADEDVKSTMKCKNINQSHVNLKSNNIFLVQPSNR